MPEPDDLVLLLGVELVEWLHHILLIRLVVHHKDLLETHTDQLQVAKGFFLEIVGLCETVMHHLLTYDWHEPLLKDVLADLLDRQEACRLR